MAVTHSESLDMLAAALAKAQGAVSGAEKSALNPHFNRNYADLASVWDAMREPFSANGLSIAHFPTFGDNQIGLETMLLHSSGQWIRSDVFMPFEVERGRNAAQSVGSAVTYLRRYVDSAIGSVCPKDDDGEASGRKGERPAPKQERKPENAGAPVISEKQIKLIWARAKAKAVPPPAVGEIVHRVAGVESMSEIPAVLLDAVLAEIAAWAPPPEPPVTADTAKLPPALAEEDEKDKLAAEIDALLENPGTPEKVRITFGPLWVKTKWTGSLEDVKDLYERIMKAGKREVAAPV
jgi:hypothetical protein